MSSKETTYKKPRIEKFKGKFKEIDGGGTILFTKTIQSIRNPNDLAIYVYLASKPDEWNVNIKELMTHFIKMGRDKVYKCLNDLCLIGLMERKEKRNKSGKFLEYQYFLYLKPVPCFQELNKPLPDLWSGRIAPFFLLYRDIFLLNLMQLKYHLNLRNAL